MENKMLEVLNQKCELIDRARKNGMQETVNTFVSELIVCIGFFTTVTGKPLDLICEGDKTKVVYRET